MTTHLKRLPTTFGLDTVAANAAVGVAMQGPVSVDCRNCEKHEPRLRRPETPPSPRQMLQRSAHLHGHEQDVAEHDVG